MVAAGNDQGIVTVFQIPKIPPDTIPESMKPKKSKQVSLLTFHKLIFSCQFLQSVHVNFLLFFIYWNIT